MFSTLCGHYLLGRWVDLLVTPVADGPRLALLALAQAVVAVLGHLKVDGSQR